MLTLKAVTDYALAILLIYIHAVASCLLCTIERQLYIGSCKSEKIAAKPLASIPGLTEDRPGINCLRMRHIIPRNWGLWITSYYAQ